MSPLVKVCPSCDTINPATASFCSECEWDLMGVVPTPRSEVAPPTQTAESTNFALASEGATEESADSSASVSHEDETQQVADLGAVCTLELIENPGMQFKVRDGQTVGRSNRADVELAGVPGREYLSRIHARVFRRGPQWFAQYLSSGNFIKVDGETYEDDSEVALEDGSLLTLSLTTFRVHLN